MIKLLFITQNSILGTQIQTYWFKYFWLPNNTPTKTKMWWDWNSWHLGGSYYNI